MCVHVCAYLNSNGSRIFLISYGSLYHELMKFPRELPMLEGRQWRLNGKEMEEEEEEWRKNDILEITKQVVTNESTWGIEEGDTRGESWMGKFLG